MVICKLRGNDGFNDERATSFLRQFSFARKLKLQDRAWDDNYLTDDG